MCMWTCLTWHLLMQGRQHQISRHACCPPEASSQQIRGCRWKGLSYTSVGPEGPETRGTSAPGQLLQGPRGWILWQTHGAVGLSVCENECSELDVPVFSDVAQPCGQQAASGLRHDSWPRGRGQEAGLDSHGALSLQPPKDSEGQGLLSRSWGQESPCTNCLCLKLGAEALSSKPKSRTWQVGAFFGC